MYPNLYFFLKETFHFEPWGFTQYINSFGLFVALSFVLGSYILGLELKRKEKNGELTFKEEIVTIGEGVKIPELLFNFVFGFIVGYKVVGIFFNDSSMPPQEYVFSSQGSLIGGFALGLLFSGLLYMEMKKSALAKPEKKLIRVYPHERIGDITVMAAVAGFIGAKIFDNLENWDRFIQNPIMNLLSPSGLTFYGGFICAAIAILVYAKRKNIGGWALCDAMGPVLILTYATGRIGCMVAGDGDWGIFNSAYTLSPDGKIIPGSEAIYQQAIANGGEFSRYLMSEYGSLDKIPHVFFKGLEWLPNWFWAYNFPHNVNEVGVSIAGCTGSYCNQINPLVFPTPFYETIACLLLFGLLWFLRKKINFTGQLFGIYLFVNGLERFCVEKIRVNSTYSLWGFHPTQAEIISSLLMVAGILIFVLKGKMKKQSPVKPI
jgi:prolipoprotein diacylglyceryltransferase